MIEEHLTDVDIAIREDRALVRRYRLSLAELGERLDQRRRELTGHGAFKRYWGAAGLGLTEEEVHSALRAYKNQQDTADKCQPQPHENKRHPSQPVETVDTDREARIDRAKKEFGPFQWPNKDDEKADPFERMAEIFSAPDHALQFLRLIGPDIARKAYLEACKQFHPDKGGDEDKMRKLSVLWKQVEPKLIKQLTKGTK